MAVPCSLLLELTDCTPYSSGNPHKGVINHPSCVLDFHQNPAFTLPVSKLFYLRCATLKIPSFRDFRGADLLCSSGEESHPAFVHLWEESSCTTARQFRIYVKAEQKPAPLFVPSARVPAPMTGNSTALQHVGAICPCNQGDHQTKLSLLGFCPTSPPEHL